MTPNKVVSAYRAIKEISGTVFPYKTARAVARLKNRLHEEFDVIDSAECAMIKKHGGKINGVKYTFDTRESAEKFHAEHNSFMEQDADIKLPVVDLSDYTDMLRLSPDTIEALDGIVIFEREALVNG